MPLLVCTILYKKTECCVLPPARRLIRAAFFPCKNATDVKPKLDYACRCGISKLSIEVVEWVEARGKLSVCSLQINDLVA